MQVPLQRPPQAQGGLPGSPPLAPPRVAFQALQPLPWPVFTPTVTVAPAGLGSFTQNFEPHISV